ncbi:hypothetical protein V1477_012141 [Vespula maculifrons]|uniref:Uncharacterized protein n=1 Tax=Vespula maculifrons TaxID=7453 RepID=A0ABD2BX83_VESMC
MPFVQAKFAKWGDGLERRQQYGTSDRLIQSLVQLCFGLRRGNLEIFADTIPSTIYEEFTQVQYSITHIFEILYYFFSFRLRFCTFGDFENLSRRMDLKVFADAIRASIREQLIRIYNSLFDLRLNLRSGETVSRDDNNMGPLTDLYRGILGFERRQQYRTSDRLIQLLVQLCFGLRRGNLEICGYHPFYDLRRTPSSHYRVLGNRSRRVDLEIFAPSRVFDYLSLPMDLEIFPPSRVFANLFPQVDLEILARSDSRKY